MFPYTAEIGIWQLQHLAAGALQISQGVTNSKKRNVPSSRDQYSSSENENLFFMSSTAGELLFPHFFMKHTSLRSTSVGTQANCDLEAQRPSLEHKKKAKIGR